MIDFMALDEGTGLLNGLFGLWNTLEEHHYSILVLC